MTFELPPLPFEKNALEPFFSPETLEFHHGKLHRAYITNLNSLLIGTKYERMSLDEIVAKSSGCIFYNAAQVWNHSFYWKGLSPYGGGEPDGLLAEAINAAFGSFVAFKEKFTQCLLNNFGLGWIWLLKNADGSLMLTATANAGCPLTLGGTPLLACTVLEHAYFTDYRDARLKYLYAFWALINWNFVMKNYCES